MVIEGETSARLNQQGWIDARKVSEVSLNLSAAITALGKPIRFAACAMAAALGNYIIARN